MCHYPTRPLQPGPRAQNCCPRQHAKGQETGDWKLETGELQIPPQTVYDHLYYSQERLTAPCLTTFHSLLLSFQRVIASGSVKSAKHTGCVGSDESKLDWSLENYVMKVCVCVCVCVCARSHQSCQGSPELTPGGTELQDTEWYISDVALM